MPNEEYALVLDYLPKGKSSSFKTEPVAQVVGTEFFTLLEVVPKKELKALEKIYVGKEVRQHIEYIKKRITYSELTSNSVAELEKAIEKIIKSAVIEAYDDPENEAALFAKGLVEKIRDLPRVFDIYAETPIPVLPSIAIKIS